MIKKTAKVLFCVLLAAAVLSVFSVTVFAAGDVAGAIENTWNAAKGQIQTVVNNVVFPVCDMILAILFFVKVGTAYFDYRKHGQFEFAAPCILFAALFSALPHRCISGLLFEFIYLDFPQNMWYVVVLEERR